MKALIIAHGIGNIEYLKEISSSFDVIICADGGAEYAYKCGIIPHYLIGDFDSLDDNILDYYISKDVKIDRYPQKKDFTDTQLCVYKALKEGCSEIAIFAGIGDRIDHSLGNIGILHLIKSNGAKGCIISKDQIIYICDDEITIKGNKGDLLSIIPFMGDAVGITTEGLEYPLKNDTIKFGYPTGVSNVMIEDICRIKITSGEILVIKQNNI